jgi:subtilase family serine protease
MSQRQRLPESEAAAALELLTLREEIAELALSETRLKVQVLELQSQITSYKASAPRSESGASASASQQWSGPLDRLAALQAQLAEAKEQQAQLLGQKAEMTARQQAAQKRLSDLRAGLQRDATWQQASPPWEEKTSPPRRKPPRRVGIALLSGLLLIVVLGSLIHFAHVSSLDLSLLTNAPSQKSAAPEEPPFYAPATTAPTNQGCLTTIKFDCFSPQYIQQAMGLTQLYKGGLTGRGQTIVLIGAGIVTTLPSDLKKFDRAWGLPDPKLTILYPDGQPVPYICPDGDHLQYENILNVEWAHAIAPDANIVLLIGSNAVSQTDPASNCALTSLQQDIAYALDHNLGKIISVSAGESELGNIVDTTPQHADMQQYLTQGHALLERAAKENVTVVAGAGDSGATNPNDYPESSSYWTIHNVSWPASDPDALAVGGTTLRLGNAYYDDAYDGETAWGSPESGSTGGGLSIFFDEPDYQKLVPNQKLFQDKLGMGKRAVPDVAFPATNLLVYDSGQDGALIKANPQWSHWDVAQGTSIAAAAWAGLIAIANQLNALPLGLVQPALYRLQGQGLHDITSGNNTYQSVSGYQAQKGFDLVSGWGTPFAQTFVPALLQASDDVPSDCGEHQSQCS